MENYSPVIDDSNFKIILLTIQRLRFNAWPLNVETVVLHGNLEEEMYMKVPKGWMQRG